MKRDLCNVFMQHCFFRDSNRPVPYNGIDLQARKVVQYMMFWGDETDTPEGHGTHVAGSIVGDTEEDQNAFSGMAPGAKLGVNVSSQLLISEPVQIPL